MPIGDDMDIDTLETDAVKRETTHQQQAGKEGADTYIRSGEQQTQCYAHAVPLRNMMGPCACIVSVMYHECN